MSFPAPFQPPQRSFECVPRRRLVRHSWDHVVERHRDVRAERPLDLDRALGGEEAARAVQVALELDAVVAHPAEPLVASTSSSNMVLNAERGSRNAEQAPVLPFRVPRSHFRVHMTAIPSPYE